MRLIAALAAALLLAGCASVPTNERPPVVTKHKPAKLKPVPVKEAPATVPTPAPRKPTFRERFGGWSKKLVPAWTRSPKP
jgi:hypothetical protein